jgi:hypothetical protein
MRIVTLEEHVLPRDMNAALGPAGLAAPPAIAERLDDLTAARLAGMDAAGIDFQVLSFVGHGIQELEPSRALAMAREANDRLAAAVAARPDRFGAFALLPLTDPAAGVAELHRAVSELGFAGAMIHGQTHGRFLDDPAFGPLLSEAQALGVPVYLHPAEPAPAVRQAYFSGLEPRVAQALATGAWGWHAELGMHVLRLAVSGTLERFPELQLIVGHMGENLPFSLARADERLSPLTGLPRSVAQTLREQLHITTTGYTTYPPLLCALQVFGADRLMFSVDYPFSDNAQATAFLATAPLSPGDREKLAHGNAERLLPGIPRT